MKINIIPIFVILVLAIALVFVLGAGCEEEKVTGETIKQPEIKESTVIIEGFAFNPQEVSVKIGSKVTWKNEGSHMHRIINNQAENLIMGDLFDIILKPGEQGSFIFNKAGEYSYHCHLHPNMKGKIVVE